MTLDRAVVVVECSEDVVAMLHSRRIEDGEIKSVAELDLQLQMTPR